MLIIEIVKANRRGAPKLIKRYKPYFVVVIALVVFSGLYVLANDSFSKEQKEKVSTQEVYASVNPSSDDEQLLYKHKHYVSHFAVQEQEAQNITSSSREQNREQNREQISEQNSDSNLELNLESNITVSVWLQQQNKVETVSLEDYVLAVTLHEIPWSFQDEAVKAQMIAARTYIMYRLANEHNSDKAYDVTDSTMHQVYRNIDESTLSENEQLQLERFKRLLEETKGKVITYDDNVIDALYFSTSNGKTESAGNYFNTPFPYLKSVKSAWDIDISPSYNKQVEYTYEQFFTRLKQANILDDADAKSNITIKVVERSSSNRILGIKVNGQELTGRQFREILGLASTDFSWHINKQEKKISFTTTGYGHGVGMSQWGAEGMAREGYMVDDILHHYYTDIDVTSL